MLDTLKQLIFGSGGLRGELAKGAIGSFSLKAINALMNLTISILLARVLAPEGLGIYVFAFSLVSLLGIPVQLGLPTLLLREVARYHHAARWDLLRGIIRRANQAVLLLSLVIGLTAAGVIWWFADRLPRIQLATFAWALPLLPLGALNRLREAALGGLMHVVRGQFPDFFLRPGLLLIFLCIALLIGSLTPPLAMALYCIAAALAFLLGTVMLQRALPIGVRPAKADYDTSAWARSILPLSLVSGISVIVNQTDVFMLGLLATKEQVGLYRVAFSGAALIIFTYVAVSAVVAPHIARLYSAGDRVPLQRMLTQSARLGLAAALPVAGMLILFGEPILGFVFGDRFRASYPALAILCVGQLVNAAVGMVHDILNMTGNERETLKGAVIATIVNVVLNAALIPLFGGVGAALATTVSLVTVNLLLWHKVRVRVGLQSAAFRFLVAEK